jgi:hypothetical protein
MQEDNRGDDLGERGWARYCGSCDRTMSHDPRRSMMSFDNTFLYLSKSYPRMSTSF